jgi:hypothetical protein
MGNFGKRNTVVMVSGLKVTGLKVAGVGLNHFSTGALQTFRPADLKHYALRDISVFKY